MKKLVAILFIIGVAIVIGAVVLIPNIEQSGYASVFSLFK